jgi:antitoxin HicB
MSHKHRFEDYAFRIEPLSAEDGGGFLITFPDLAGCMSDGESVEEAILNGRDAFEQWAAVQLEERREMPKPGAEAEAARFVQRLPRYIHQRLTDAARQEGVSVNTLVTTFVAEGLVARQSTLESGQSYHHAQMMIGTFTPGQVHGDAAYLIASPVAGNNIVPFPKKGPSEPSLTAANSLAPVYGVPLSEGG